MNTTENQNVRYNRDPVLKLQELIFSVHSMPDNLAGYDALQQLARFVILQKKDAFRTVEGIDELLLRSPNADAAVLIRKRKDSPTQRYLSVEDVTPQEGMRYFEGVQFKFVNGEPYWGVSYIEHKETAERKINQPLRFRR